MLPLLGMSKTRRSTPVPGVDDPSRAVRPRRRRPRDRFLRMSVCLEPLVPPHQVLRSYHVGLRYPGLVPSLLGTNYY